MAAQQKTTDIDLTKDIKSGIYQVQAKRGGTFKVMHREEPDYNKEMEDGLKHKPNDRANYLKQLTPQEQKFIQAANESGKGVRWADKNGNHIFTFVPTQEQKEKAAAQAKEAAQGEEEKKGFWARNGWLKWVIGIGTVGLGVGLYFMLRKKKNKSSANSETTNSNSGTSATTADTATSGAQKISEIQITPPTQSLDNSSNTVGNGLTSTLGQNSSGTVDLGLGSSGLEGYTPQIGITGLPRSGR